MYEVVTGFVDLQDNNYIYRTGDSFPRAGVDVSKERIAELASTSNKCGVVLIKATKVEEPVVEIKKKPRKTNKKEK